MANFLLLYSGGSMPEESSRSKQQSCKRGRAGSVKSEAIS